MAHGGGGYNPHPAKRRVKVKPKTSSGAKLGRSIGAMTKAVTTYATHPTAKTKKRAYRASRKTGRTVAREGRKAHRVKVRQRKQAGAFLDKLTGKPIRVYSRGSLDAQGKDRFRYSMLDKKSGKAPSDEVLRSVDAKLAKFNQDVHQGKLKGIGEKGFKLDDGTRVFHKKNHELKIGGVNVNAVTGKAASAANTALEQTTRPIHALAAAERDFLKHGTVGTSTAKAFGEGLANKRKDTFSDVVGDLGVKNKTLKSVLGFVGDTAGDPLTYVSGGAAPVARIAAKKAAEKAIVKRASEREAGKLSTPALKTTGAGQKAGKKAYHKALAKGATPQAAAKVGQEARASADVARQAQRVKKLDTRAARRAGKAAARKAPEGRGVQVGIGKFKTSGATSSKALRPVRHVLKDSKVAELARDVGSTFSPHVRPAGLSDTAHEALKGAGREARAAAAQGRRHAIARGIALKHAIPEESHAAVIDAIERGTVEQLPKHLKDSAKAVEHEFKQARKREVRSGIKTAQVSGTRYFTHQLEDVLAEGAQKGGKAGKTVKAGYAKQRVHKGTLAKIAEEGGPEFSTKVPLVVADRLARSARDTAKAKLNRAVLQAGRRVTPGKVHEVGPHEALYKVEGSTASKVDLKTKTGREEFQKAAAGRGQGKYVIANEKAVDRQLEGIGSRGEELAVKQAWDKTTGGFKRIATMSPGFHARNLYGDFSNAVAGAPAPRVVKAVGTSARALKRQGAQEEAAHQIGKKLGESAHVTVKDEVGRKVKMRMDDLIKEAVSHGALRTGYTGKELPDLMNAEGKVSRLTGGTKARRVVGRQMQNREDLMRGATYIAARQEGATAREAAAKVARQHFDYGDLSPLERNFMRRLLPFYTFTSRNVPLQAKTLLTKPGKAANFQKAREEIAKNQGIDLHEWEKGLKEYQLRALPVPVKVGDHTFAVSIGGLPIADLNEIPMPGSKTWGPGALDEWASKFASMLNPVVRTPTELFANYNFFFRGPIKDSKHPLVAAPSYVAHFPAAMRKKLGIVSDYVDRQTGKKGWGWPAKTDYVAKVIPGPPNILQGLITGGTSRRGQGQGGKLLSAGLGIKSDKIDPEAIHTDHLFKLLDRYQEQAATLRQRGKKGTPQAKKLNRKIGSVMKEINHISVHRGDKVPTFSKSKKKPTVKPSGKGGMYGGSGGGGGMY